VSCSVREEEEEEEGEEEEEEEEEEGILKDPLLGNNSVNKPATNTQPTKE
jgi:hypothetical protein